MSRFSVVIPVKDGERYLAEVLAAVVQEQPAEILVIDSGSRDASRAIARAAGADVLQIPASTFGHGRTRNLGAERTTGELICFLTQDATPVAGWLAAYEEAFALAERVGAAYGPHLPRPDTSPMIARELEEFFRGVSPDGSARVQLPGGESFLSNVNACYARACWETIRFRDVPYAEDQAFGRDLLAAGWSKVYHPGAAVLHAHDYGWSGFMRRYFDEYRGLRETVGHVEALDLRRLGPQVGASVRQDIHWLRAHRHESSAQSMRWAVRSAAHHGGRRLFASLGSRSSALPAALSRRISLERRAAPAQSAEPRGGDLPQPRQLEASLACDDYATAAEVWREGPAPLLEPREDMSRRSRLHIAMVIPPFTRGSGGHNTLLQILSRLEARGHLCSVWVQDYLGQLGGRRAAVLRREMREYFAPVQAPVYRGFEEWSGADVVLATGWQTAHPVLRLPDCYARVYVVNDHEPDFYPVSVEQLLAADTYRHGMHCIAASPWLRDLVHDRYGASADAFQLGVDHRIYRPSSLPPQPDTVIYYARHSTPRRAVPLGLMALSELHRRRPQTRIILFGTAEPVDTAFPYEHVGALRGEQLAALYAQATVGLCLSLTNFSLMPKEMLACGLPCVELAGISAESIFGEDGPLLLAPPDPERLATALAEVLDDAELRERRSAAGRAFVASHTWDAATDEVEEGIRHAVRSRHPATAA